MTKLGSARIATDVALTDDLVDEVVDLIPVDKLRTFCKTVFKPMMVMAASLGVADTATMAEIVGAARLNGEATPSIGYDITIPHAGKQGYVEVKTRTAIKNSSGNTTRNEQKVTVSLTDSQRKKADYLFLTAVATDFETNQKVITYFIIPRQSMTAKAFDIRFNKEGRPIGNCKYSQYAFFDKAETQERLESTKSYRLEEAIIFE